MSNEDIAAVAVLFGSLGLAGIAVLIHYTIGFRAFFKAAWYLLTTNHKRK